MRFASTVFLVADIYGILILSPLYFLESRIGREQPPSITQPEYFYGFAGAGFAWEVVFLVSSTDPVRYRTTISGFVSRLRTRAIVALRGARVRLSTCIPVARSASCSTSWSAKTRHLFLSSCPESCTRPDSWPGGRPFVLRLLIESHSLIMRQCRTKK
jgi:hypothetical protein